MDIEREIVREIKNTEQILRKVNDEISGLAIIAGDDRVNCHKSNGVYQYSIQGKYVTRDKVGRAKAIAQLGYDRKIKIELEKKIASLKELHLYYTARPIEKTYIDLCGGRKNIVTPIIEANDDFVAKWENVEYPPSGRWEDVKTEIYTHKNERVRSKVEKIIADELTNYKIPYRYEYPYELILGKRKVEFRPDFTALNTRTRKEFVIEHLGMMDKVGYYNSTLSKLDAFEKNGFMIGVNLIILHETYDEPLSVPVLRRYIEEYLI